MILEGVLFKLCTPRIYIEKTISQRKNKYVANCSVLPSNWFSWSSICRLRWCWWHRKIVDNIICIRYQFWPLCDTINKFRRIYFYVNDLLFVNEDLFRHEWIGWIPGLVRFLNPANETCIWTAQIVEFPRNWPAKNLFFKLLRRRLILTTDRDESNAVSWIRAGHLEKLL